MDTYEFEMRVRDAKHEHVRHMEFDSAKTTVEEVAEELSKALVRELGIYRLHPVEDGR